MEYLTQEGLDKLNAELHQLETVERPSVTQQIADARDKGDLSENAEYDAAKEAQGMLEMRISKLKKIISDGKIIKAEDIDTSKVSILTTVIFMNNAAKAKMKYTLVPESETDLANNKISVNTPIAKGLLGKKVGENVKITLPNGNVLDLDILEITL